MSHSRSSNVVQSKARIYELLLVIYSNFRRITPRFRNTSCFNAENYIFAYPLYLTLNLKVMQLECGEEIWRQKTKIMGLPYTVKKS